MKGIKDFFMAVALTLFVLMLPILIPIAIVGFLFVTMFTLVQLFREERKEINDKKKAESKE